MRWRRSHPPWMGSNWNSESIYIYIIICGYIIKILNTLCYICVVLFTYIS